MPRDKHTNHQTFLLSSRLVMTDLRVVVYLFIFLSSWDSAVAVAYNKYADGLPALQLLSQDQDSFFSYFF